MKTFSLNILYVFTYITVLFSLCFGQNYIVEQIPAPHLQVTKAELFPGINNSVHVLGISDTLIPGDFEEHLFNLFLTTRNSNGFPGEFTVLDTGYSFSGGFSGMEDAFNCTLSDNLSGQLAIVWTKQRYPWTDIINQPGYLNAPVMKFGIKNNNIFSMIFEYTGADNPQIKTDQYNSFHLVYQKVMPICPDIKGYTCNNSNYYYNSSEVIYDHIYADGTLGSTIKVGNGFLPHIHIGRNGIIHVFWLEADSSNSKYFKLLYTQKSVSNFEPAITIRDSIPGQWDEYNVHDYPQDYFSFVDDLGNVYAGWTDNNIYNAGKIFFASLPRGGTVSIDSVSGLSLMGSSGIFSVELSGNVHALWGTYSYPNRAFHYSKGSTGNKVFSETRTFQSIYDKPLIFLYDGIANGIFNTYKGIEYFYNLESGPDTTTVLAPGSLSNGFSPLRIRSANENTILSDDSDYIYLLSTSNDSIKFVKIDSSITDVRSDVNTPAEFVLFQNYPNPFNPITTIKFSIKEESNVKISISDILGQKISDILNENMSPGSHKIKWNARNYSSGMYFYSLYINDKFISARKLLLTK